MILLANILQPISDLAEVTLKFFHDDIGFGWGPAIVALTFATRLVLLPLSVKQIRSMRELSALQPHMKELQERYKDDRQRLQREMMQLYQEHGVNPFASCLPLLLQLPVFLALFYLLRSDSFQADVLEAPPVGWLFIDNLTAKATGGALVALLVLYVGTQLVAGLIMAGSGNPQQRMIILALPLLFAPIIVRFPSGLVVYWIATNVWTMGQQAVIRVFFPPQKPPTPEEIQAAKPPPPPPRKRKRRR